MDSFADRNTLGVLGQIHDEDLVLRLALFVVGKTGENFFSRSPSCSGVKP